MARPKSITDEAILKEAYALIMEQGPGKLTFEGLGARVGLVPAALVKRFKNKQQLVMQIDRYALSQTSRQSQEALEAAKDPIEAIIIQFVTELQFASSIERFANGQEFLIYDLRQKELYDNYQESFAERHKRIVEFLQSAESAGLVAGIVSYDQLARHLEMVAHGAGQVWAMTQEGPIEQYIAEHVQFALRPFVV